jgi:hypothetical protein
MNDPAQSGVAIGNGHTQCIGDQRRGLTRVDRPTDYTPRESVQNDGTVHLTFIRAMLSYVGDPQPIWRFAGEHSLDQIGGSRSLVSGSRTPVTRQSLDNGPGHQHLHLVMPDHQPEPQGQLGVDPAGTVGAT